MLRRNFLRVIGAAYLSAGSVLAELVRAPVVPAIEEYVEVWETYFIGHDGLYTTSPDGDSLGMVKIAHFFHDHGPWAKVKMAWSDNG